MTRSRVRWSLVFCLAVVVMISAFQLPMRAGPRVQLQFPHPQWGEAGFREWWLEVVDAFHKENPGIEIVGSSVDFGTFLDKLVVQVRTGTAPDLIFQVSALPTYMAMDAYEPLDERLAKTPVPQMFYATQKTWPVWKGKTYAVVMMHNVWEMFYNKRLFQEAGIARPPATVQELFEAARKLTLDKNRDGVTDQFGYCMVTADQYPHRYNTAELLWVWGMGGNFARNGVPTATDPKTVEGMKAFKRLYDDGLVPKNVKLADCRQMFWEGKVAMWIDINGFYGSTEQTAPGVLPSVGVARVPFENHRTLYNAVTVGISKTSRYKEEAWRFVEFTTKIYWQRRIADVTKTVPGRKGVIDAKFIAANPWFKPFLDGIEGGNAITSPPPGFEAKGEEYKKIISDHVTEMLTRNLSVEETMKRLQRALEEFARRTR